MTQATIRKVQTLVQTKRANLKRVKEIGGASPFSSSAAKYYPALKKLAEK
jgi:hypothetical protein